MHINNMKKFVYVILFLLLISISFAVLINLMPRYDSIDINVSQTEHIAHLNISRDSLWNNLMFYMPFDVNTTTQFDYARYNLSGNLTNVRWNNTDLYDGGMHFISTSSQISVGDNDYILNFNGSTESFTVMAWIYPTRDNNFGYIVNKMDANDDGWTMQHQINRIGCSADQKDFYSLAGAVRNYTWNHVVCVFNKTGNGQVYIDGVINGTPVALLNESFNIEKRTLRIGNYVTNWDFRGIIDEVMIFNRSLSGDEILAIYTNQTKRYPINGTQTFENMNLSTIGTENRINISLRNVSHLYGSNLSVKFNNDSYISIDNSTIYNLSFTSNPNFVNMTFLYQSGTNQFYSPVLIGNITLVTWFDFQGIDSTPPYFAPSLVNITIEQNDSLIYDINASDSETGFRNYSINGTDFSIDYLTGILINNTVLGIVRPYFINVTIVDNSLNYYSSVMMVNVTSKTYPPTVNLELQQNYNTSNPNNINLTFNITDASNTILNASLYINGTYNKTIYLPTINITNSFYYNSSDGYYSYSISAFNLNNKSAFSANRTFFVDSTSPTLSILNPLNNSNTNPNILNLSVNITDNFGIKNATLYIYNSSNDLVYNITYSETKRNFTDLYNVSTYTYGATPFNFIVVNKSSEFQPSKGECIDTKFGLDLCRFTDMTTESPTPTSTSQKGIRAVYTRWRHDSATKKYVYFEHETTNYRTIVYYYNNMSVFKNITEIYSMENFELRWDAYDDNILYYVSGCTFRQYNLSTGTTSLIHDFTDIEPTCTVAMNDVEGDSSMNSRYWAFMLLQGTTIKDWVTYDKTTNTILGKMNVTKYNSFGGNYTSLPRPNMIDISPNGDKVVPLNGYNWGQTKWWSEDWAQYNNTIWYANYSTSGNILSSVYENDTSTSYTLTNENNGNPNTTLTSSSKALYDRTNNKIYVWTSDGASPNTHLIKTDYGSRSNDVNTPFNGVWAWDLTFTNASGKLCVDETHSGWAWSQTGDEMFICQDNKRDWLTATNMSGYRLDIIYHGDIGWGNGFHFGRIYNTDIKGWIQVPTYASWADTDWGDNIIFMMELKNNTNHPRIWRIANNYNNWSGIYEREGNAPMSADGQTIFISSAWINGTQPKNDVYKVELPYQWWNWIDTNESEKFYLPQNTINAAINISYNFASLGTYKWSYRTTDYMENLYNSPNITLNVVSSDLIPPYFSPSLSNQTVEYGKSFSYNINASDNVMVDAYFTNSTEYFDIDVNTGVLTNLTRLAQGIYSISITVSDTSANTATNNFLLNVTKGIGLVKTYLNNANSNLSTYDTTTNIGLNATLINGEGYIVLYKDSILINNGTYSIANYTNLTAGVYNITSIYYGNDNYTSSYDSLLLTIVSSASPPASGGGGGSMALTENNTLQTAKENVEEKSEIELVPIQQNTIIIFIAIFGGLILFFKYKK